MQNTHETDFHLSHSIVNYLNAQYRAHYAFVNALLQLASPDITKDIAEKTQKNLTMVVKWNKDLYGGMPIFSAAWKYPETFDAQKAFDLLAEVKADILKINKIIKEITEAPDAFSKPEDLKFLLASNIRYAYGRENYIKGFIEYAKYQGDQDMLNSYSQGLQPATAEIKKASAHLREMKETNTLSEASMKELKESIKVLKCIFRSYVQDLNYFMAIYDAKYTFERAEFSEQEAQAWQAADFDPNTASYWRAYDFKPQEAAEWMQVGVYESCNAYIWKEFKFTPESATPWLNLNANPDEACRLTLAGKTPDWVYNEMMKAAEKSAA